MRAEAAGGDRYPLAADVLDELVVHLLGLFRRSGGNKAGATALAAIAVERELADDQHRPPDLGQRAIHLALVSSKDPEAHDLVRQPAEFRVGIRLGHAQQHEQPSPI